MIKIKYLFIIIINILFSIFLVHKISQITLRWIDSYTKHGSYVVVPNIQYLTLSKSISIIKKLGLKYNVKNIYKNEINFFKKHKVIFFYPKNGSYIKKGRCIFIWINNNSKELFKSILPKIINKKESTAIEILNRNNIFIKKIKYKNKKQNYNKNVVLKVIYNNKIIYPGYIFPFYNNYITLIIGEKNNIIPNVVGISLRKAINIFIEKKFRKIFFHVENEIYIIYNNNLILKNIFNKYKNEKICKQNPFYGKLCNYNEIIHIWIKKHNNELKNNNKKEFLDNKKNENKKENKSETSNKIKSNSKLGNKKKENKSGTSNKIKSNSKLGNKKNENKSGTSNKIKSNSKLGNNIL
ncbi:PASTA domain-containing protein [Blattabacterium cuenoti]|uniref:PASTA domain-containing protein n=1 Tax=Blattabacterium cuenoti TaxID=1653831 RepID=UPI00163C3875|nr:PASTA domain-containing protein [Blattabacterium cuenoti]